MDQPVAPLLTVDALSVHFSMRSTSPFGRKRVLRAVDDVSFEVDRGESFGIVGESGSGKSTTAAAIMRLVDLTAGRIIFDETPVHALGGEALRLFRRRLQIIFQDPYSSLNPRGRVFDLVREPLDIQEIGTRHEREDRVANLLAQVGLRADMFDAFPHQFSGGQRQRIGIARALATTPDLIVCDEPVSALDVAVQAQILNLLKRLQRDFGLTYVFISHDLAVVRYMCSRVAVMYRGSIMETGSSSSLFRNPAHPYTRALLSARPLLHGRAPRAHRRPNVPASTLAAGASGCRFADRCPQVSQRCREERPVLRQIASGHRAACHALDVLT